MSDVRGGVVVRCFGDFDFQVVCVTWFPCEEGARSVGTYISCKGSVDTPTTGVDTGFQTLRQNDEEKVKCVDTASCGVDTRPSSQRTQLTGLYSVSTQPQVVSTLDPVPRGPVCQTGTMCRHSLGKLQTILSRGRTWESRRISGEKLAVLRNGADPTEEQQQKKNFWHFRCHQSIASWIEEDLQ
ncbi:hypothetical protein Taro_018695 [Colocasia esculenta]|uniref:Uncharacterized protein n=1 Tax=Colocasia esculenta TaxID=4460 RepID=A0A843URF4_COLES|nr:hypothetical protein [Colocasia esculenta]